MKSNKNIFLFLLFSLILCLQIKAQATIYDSITISKFTADEKNSYAGNWNDSLEYGKFQQYLANEKTIWKNTKQTAKSLVDITQLTKLIRTNGTEDISKCFIPRHSVNYYKNGKIILFMLVCFECEGVRFSDIDGVSAIQDVKKRIHQIETLKKIFKEYNLINK